MSDQTTPSDSHPDPIDIEAYAKEGKAVPQDRRYQIRVDNDRFIIESSTITGREVLALVNKAPETHILHLRERGGATRTIEADESVDLTDPGPERFMTMARETQEGLSDPRRDFKIPPADQAFLDGSHPQWEAIAEGGAEWIVIRDFPLGDGYTVTSADVAIQLPAGYPEAGLDMAYFHPALQRIDGKAIPQLDVQALDGRPWQRWSRHRTHANQWRPGEDCLCTHIAYISSFLRDEFRKRP